MADNSDKGRVEPPLPEGAVVDNEPVGTPTDVPSDHVIVEYKGEAPLGREFISSREITKADLKAIHIDAPGDLVWNAANGWKVDIGSEFTDLLAYFRKDAGFTVHKAS